MKIDRLLGITIYLLNHGRSSAQVLAQHFEVSQRTIMRDMDTLCLSGIPVVSTYGVDGGYEIMDTFRMQQQIAGEMDYQYVICALQGLATAYASKDIEATLEKMESLSDHSQHIMHVDLSVAHENCDTNETLFLLNQLIQKKHQICYWYTNSRNERKETVVEPVETIYKWYNWYLIGYCVKYQEYRMYKVVRMDNVRMLPEENSRVHNIKEVNEGLEQKPDQRKTKRIVIHCNANLRSKCREYLNGRILAEYENGEYDYELTVPEDETFWYGVLLSFGADAKVLEPSELIERIQMDCRKVMERYQ